MLVLALLWLRFPLVTHSQNSVTNVENPSIGELVQQLKSGSIQARLDATYTLSRIDPPVAAVAVPAASVPADAATAAAALPGPS